MLRVAAAVTEDMKIDTIKALRALGTTVIRAPNEGDGQFIRLQKEKLAEFVVGVDNVQWRSPAL